MVAAACEALAGLLEYPSEGFHDRAREAEAILRRERPEVAAALEGFLGAVRGSAITALEETYTRTFDWVPERSLELGWHLHGEQYERGAFLVRMRDRLREAGLPEGDDLPDHLATCLRLVARMGEEEAAVFVPEVLLRAVDRLRQGFERAEKDNPYADLVGAVRSALAASFPAAATAKGR